MNIDDLFAKKSIIVDANNIFYATYSVSTYHHNGEFYGAVMGFINLLSKCLRQFSPENVFIVWDGVNSRSKRQVINENYKQQRSVPVPYQLNKLNSPLNEEDLKIQNENRSMQKNLLVSVLETLPYHNINIENLEADDIISVLSRKFGFNKDKVIIVSNDKDFYQLLSDNVSIYRPIDKSVFTVNDLLKKDNIYPCNYALARAMEGDKSDNLPGVKSAGLTTIQKRIELFTKDKKITMDQLFETVFILNEKKKYVVLSNILQNRQLIEDNYKIMQLYDIELSPEENSQLRDIIECNPSFKEKKFDDLCTNFTSLSSVKNFKTYVKKYNDVYSF